MTGSRPSLVMLSTRPSYSKRPKRWARDPPQMIRHRHFPPEASPPYLLPTIQLINLLSTFINHRHYPSPQHTPPQTDIVACSSVVSIVSYYLHPRLLFISPAKTSNQVRLSNPPLHLFTTRQS